MDLSSGGNRYTASDCRVDRESVEKAREAGDGRRGFCRQITGRKFKKDKIIINFNISIDGFLFL